jgi:c-di-GMP phosphodiesterase
MRHTILVVDDQQDERDAMADLLRRHHHVVETAANGLEALDRLHDGGPLPALVLLDLSMPLMDGWEFLSHVARDRTLRRIPVIVLSGSPAVQDAIVASASVTFATKPISPASLMTFIAEMFERAARPTAATTSELAVRAADHVDTERHAAPHRDDADAAWPHRGDENTVWSPSMLP